MNIYSVIAITVLSAYAVASHASDKAPAAPNKQTPTVSKSVCKKGEIGGIVVSNKKLKDGSYRTIYAGDKTPFNTPVEAKDVIDKVAKLKAGDKNCVVDDGS